MAVVKVTVILVDVSVTVVDVPVAVVDVTVAVLDVCVTVVEQREKSVGSNYALSHQITNSIQLQSRTMATGIQLAHRQSDTSHASQWHLFLEACADDF